MSDLTAREAADRLGVSVRTLGRYVADGLITPGRTAGGHRRFDSATVDQLAAKLAGQPPPQPPPQPPAPTELPPL